MSNLNHDSFNTCALTKTYITGDTEVQALRGVDIDIHQGELVVLLGPSGSGKSTFLNIIGGLDQASSGQVFFRGQDLTKMSSKELTLYRREHIGFIFQSYNLIPSLTALENVALVTEIASQPMSPLDALDAVGLKNRASHFPSQLSGGEQQRVGIARAIVNKPPILLADEPTGNLDPKLSLDIISLFEEFNAAGVTVLIATHDLGLIARMRYRTLTLKEGTMINDGIIEGLQAQGLTNE